MEGKTKKCWFCSQETMAWYEDCWRCPCGATWNEMLKPSAPPITLVRGVDKGYGRTTEWKPRRQRATKKRSSPTTK